MKINTSLTWAEERADWIPCCAVLLPLIVKPTPLSNTIGLYPNGSNTSLSDLSNANSKDCTPVPPTTPLLGPAMIDHGRASENLSM